MYRTDAAVLVRVAYIAALATLFATFAAPAHAEEDRAYAGMWAELGKGDNTSTGAYVTYAPDGSVSEPGPRIQAFASFDRYYYDDGFGTRVTGETTEFDVLAGLTLQFGKAQVTALAGPAIVTDKISPAGNVSSSETALGVRVAMDASLQLGHGTALQASGYYKTTREDYSVSGNLQFPVLQSLRIGPSAQLKGNRGYQELKLGGVVSGFEVLDINLTLTGGVTIQDSREAAFFGLSTWTSF